MKTYEIEERELGECRTAVVHRTVSGADIGEFVGATLGAVAQELDRQAIPAAGPSFARFHRTPGEQVEAEAGFPIAGGGTPSGIVALSSLPGGPVAVMTYVGSFEDRQPLYRALADWVADRGGRVTGDPWEVYVHCPAEEPDPDKWRTEIVMPFEL